MSFLGGKSRGKDAEPEPTKATPVKRAVVSAAIETTLGPNTHFKGDVKGDAGMRIDGKMEGTVDLLGNLVITESATIRADIKANNISIAGAVVGNITATRIEILDTGRVWGDLTVKSLLVNEGAYYRGQTFMPQDLKPPQLEAPKQPKVTPEAGTVVDVEPKN